MSDLFDSLTPTPRGDIALPRGRALSLGVRPLIMGILNVTPDSFSDGGQFSERDAAVAQARQMLEDGVDVIDIGGESTRPGAEEISTTEQIRRVLPAIEGIREFSEIPISIDTRDPEVGRKAIESGADIVNDVSACRDPGWVP
ncbi:MAG: dihydropteroate synthase, partial [Planctomycetota bacterium]